MKSVSACVLAGAVLTLSHCQELNNRPIIGECAHVPRVLSTCTRPVSRVTCHVSRVTCLCPGILSQRISRGLDTVLPPGHNYTTYLAASYVKWVEGAGARAVPIIVSDNEDNLDYYDQVDRETLGSVNIFSPQDVRWY